MRLTHDKNLGANKFENTCSDRWNANQDQMIYIFFSIWTGENSNKNV